MNFNRLRFLIIGILLIAWTNEIIAQQSWMRPRETTNLTDLVWGKATAGYAISISTTNAKYLSGDPIDLRILVKNAGTNDVFLGNPWPIDYDVQVIFAGKIIELTPKGKQKIDELSGGSYTLHILKSGETEYFFYHYPLTEIYDLTSPGKYEITVSRKFYNKHRGPRCKSIFGK